MRSMSRAARLIEHFENNSLTEALDAPLSVEEFKKLMTKTYLKYFPNGNLTLSFGALGKDSISISTTLLDYVNVTRHNDPMLHTFWLHKSIDTATGNLLANVVFEKDRGSLLVNPEEGSYLAMDRVKIPFRKKTGSPRSVVAYFDKYLKKAKDVVKDNADNVYGRSKIDDKYFK